MSPGGSPQQYPEYERIVGDPAGIDHAADLLRRLGERAEEARQRVVGMAAAIKDGGYGRYTEQIEAAARSTERLTAAARNTITARALGTGELLRHSEAMGTYTRAAERMRSQL